MATHERRAAYGSLWVLALAFGWIEASVVIYLRALSLRESALHSTGDLPNPLVTFASLPDRLVGLEMAREACTLILLTAVGWLAGRRMADRIGAFVVAFGVWDLTYYAVLRLVSGWPESIGAWDILFLIPSPWVAPVWAPVVVASLFAVFGSYLFWTPDRRRWYRWADAAVLLASVCLTLAAFLTGADAAIDHRVPAHFPSWLFWVGVALGAGWFIRVERRQVRPRESARPWVDVNVRTVEATRHQTESDQPEGINPIAASPPEGDVGSVGSEYREAAGRLDSLVKQATEWAERFERLAHGLSPRPEQAIVGFASQRLNDPIDWDIVSNDPLPSIEQLKTLTGRIREVGTSVEELRERLILMGRADLVERPGQFFQ